MAKPTHNRTRQLFTPEQRREHLRGLALLEGDCTAYSQLTEAAGVRVAERTLRHWRDTKYPEEYEQIHQEALGQDSESLIRDSKRIEFKGSIAQEAFVERALRVARDEQAMGKMSAKEATEIAHRLGILIGQRQEHIARVRGEPTSIVKHVSTADVLREIQESYAVFLESDAEEIPQDALPPGETKPRERV